MGVRIDRYLKQTGLIKRRTVAQRMIESGRVLVNGRVVKSSYEVKIKDTIKIIFPFREIEAIVEEDGVKIVHQTKEDGSGPNSPRSPVS
ncbi:S4 domain-containing protein [Pseudothermotoga sp.]